jgi:hypothetical protein
MITRHGDHNFDKISRRQSIWFDTEGVPKALKKAWNLHGRPQVERDPSEGDRGLMRWWEVCHSENLGPFMDSELNIETRNRVHVVSDQCISNSHP